jgi:HEAT repeat protein
MNRSFSRVVSAIAVAAFVSASWRLSLALAEAPARAAEEPRKPSTAGISAETADQLLQKFEAAESSWRQAEVARALVALGDTKVIPRIAAQLESADRRRRCNAGLVLAGLSDERGLKAILRELGDTGPRPTNLIRSDGKSNPEGQIREDRYYAALLLGEIREKGAVPALIEATADSTINDQAAISLGQIGDRRAIPALRKMVEAFPDQKLWAGYGLAALGEAEGFDLLTEAALSDPLWTQRRHAVEALGRIGDRSYLSTMVKLLKDKHPNVRVSAAVALGRIGDREALPALTEALNDTAPTEANAPTTVAQEARKAIEAIQSRK